MPQNPDSDKQSEELQAPTASPQEDVARAAKAVKRRGAEALEQATKQAARYADEQKEAVGEHLQEFSRVIRQAGDDLGQRDQTVASQLVREAASGLETLSRSVSGSSIRDIVGSVREFGRANPAAFIGTAVLAGVALGRFARASGSRAATDHQERSWRTEGRKDESAPNGAPRPQRDGQASGSPSRAGVGAASAAKTAPAQGHGGAGKAADPARTSMPSIATGASLTTGSNASDCETASISTGESS